MIPVATRLDIINDRFAYTSDETILVNASQLCSEIIAHDKAKFTIKLLESRIETLISLLHVPSTTYRYVDLKA